MILLDRLAEAASAIEPRRIVGSVASVRGESVLVEALPLPVGASVRIGAATGAVVGFDEGFAVVLLHDAEIPLAPGAPVEGVASRPVVGVGYGLLGRVIDGAGRPIDDAPLPLGLVPRPLHVPPLGPLRRRCDHTPLATGVRAVDGMLTLGAGQRVGIFAGPGVGKSTLLSSVVRHTAADVNVVALVGERGREVREFIERTLHGEARSRTVLVVATSDTSPLLRMRAAAVACAVAEYFRDEGADVMLLMDSLTRLAHAQRQIGLAAGEPPTTKGYPPSVFAMLPRLVERAGAIEGGGSVTGLFTVLVEGDDLTEPIADAARGVLDGHLTLARRLAERGHFPPIDVLASVSRVADDVSTDAMRAARAVVRRALAARGEVEELVQIGAYASGSDPWADAAIALSEELDGFLRQAREDAGSFDETITRLTALAGALQARVDAAKRGAA